MTTESIRERLAGATPGPWSALTDRPHFVVYGDDDDSGEADVCEPYLLQDAAFIAHSRTDVELLLAAVKEAEEADLILDRITEVAANWPSFLNSELEVNLAHVKLRLRAALDALEAG